MERSNSVPPSASPDAGLRDLLVFHNVARALTSSLDRDAILRAIMQQMEQFFKPETWSLLLVDEARHDLYYAVAVGHTNEERTPSELRDLRIPIGHGLAGWVAEHGESLIVPEVSEDPRFDPRAHPRIDPLVEKDAFALRIRSAICMPLRSRSRTLGVMQLFNYRLDTLTDYTISFLHLLCDYAAIAIDNARAVERIQELTITDDCTGLYNVRHLYQLLESHTDSSATEPFSLIFIDLDHFKRVNDQHGHLIGSHLLQEVGETLRAGLRKQDSVFRYGGDEFVVMLPGAGKRAAQHVAERILKNLRERRFANVLSLEVRASLGVATWPEDGSSVHEIIRAADTMMYLVKDATRDNIAIAGKGILHP